MKRVMMLCLATVISAVSAAHAQESIFAHDSISTQIAMDAFNQGVKHRMDVARFGFYGDVDAPPAADYWQGSGNSCDLGRGFTLWGEGYFTWAKQKQRGGDSGYTYRVGGPALGMDWTNGPVTAGLATTYSWGKLKGREGINHDRDTNQWAITAYGQVNYERFYVNAAISYGYNRFKSTRGSQVYPTAGRAKYHSHAWNGELEIGTRLNICNLIVEPHIGLRYFNNKNNRFSESFGLDTLDWGSRRYHTLEMPLGVDVGYSIAVGRTMLMPKLRFAWVPQWDRKYPYATPGGAPAALFENTTPRAKHGFVVGAGVQANISSRVMANLDYNVNMRTKAYEHILNLGVGVQF